MANVDATLTLKLKDLASKEAAIAVNKITGSLNTFGTTNAASLGKATTATNALTGSFKNLAVAMGSVVSIQMATSFVKGAIAIQGAETALKTATAGFQDFNEAQQFLLETSNKLGLVYKDQIQGYAQLAASAKLAGVSLEDVKTIYLGIAEASTALQLSQDDAYGSMRAVVQMMSKDKVQAEELRGQLGERLPGAAQLAAKALGVTDMELNKLLETGKIYAKDFLPLFGQALRDNYGKAAIEASDTAQAALNRLMTALQMLQKQVMFGEGFESFKSALGEISELMGKTETVKTLKTTIAALSDVIIFAAKVVGMLIEMKVVIGIVFALFITKLNQLFKGITEVVSMSKFFVAAVAGEKEAMLTASMAVDKYTASLGILQRVKEGAIGKTLLATEGTATTIKQQRQRSKEAFKYNNIVVDATDQAAAAKAVVIATDAAKINAIAVKAAGEAGANAMKAQAIGAAAAAAATQASTAAFEKTTLAANATAASAKAAATVVASMGVAGTAASAAITASTVTAVAKTGLIATAINAVRVGWVGVSAAIAVAVGWLGRFFATLAGPLGWTILISYYIYEFAKGIGGLKGEVEFVGKAFSFVFDIIKNGLVLVVKGIEMVLLGFFITLKGHLLFLMKTLAFVGVPGAQKAADAVEKSLMETVQSAVETQKEIAKIFGQEIFVDVDIRVKGKKEKIDYSKEEKMLKAYGKDNLGVDSAAADKIYGKDILAKRVSEFSTFSKQIKKMNFDLNTDINKENRTQAQQEIRAINEKYDEMLSNIKDKLVSVKDLEKARADELAETKSPVKKADIYKEYEERISAAKIAAGLEGNIAKAKASEIAAIRKKERDTYRKEEAALINDLYGLRGQDLEAVIAATKEEEDAVKAKYERLGVITAEGERQLQLIKEKGAILANNKRFELAQKEQEIILSTTGLKIDVVRDSVRQIEARGELELEALRIEHEKIVKENVGHHAILIAEKARYEAAVAKSKSGTADEVARAKADLGAIEADTITMYANMLTHEKDRVEKAEAIKQAELIQLKADYDEQVRLHGDSKAQMLIIDANYEAKKKAAAQKAAEDSKDPLQKWAATYKETTDLAMEWTIQVYEKLSDGIVDAAWEFVEGTKSMKQAFLDFAKSFMKEMTSMILKQAMLNAVKESYATSGSGGGGGSAGYGSMISGAVSLIGTWLASAKGNVFSNGNLVAYAKGGIVDKPTMFAMKDGMGLMGEAGPEAVVPLKRMSGGRLGVSYEGEADRKPKEEKKQQVKLEINNISSPEMIERFLTSPRGQNSIMNVVGGNSKKLSKMLRV